MCYFFLRLALLLFDLGEAGFVAFDHAIAATRCHGGTSGKDYGEQRGGSDKAFHGLSPVEIKGLGIQNKRRIRRCRP
ncbi:hypothetical protein D3C81_1987910 [compost metagenome]